MAKISLSSMMPKGSGIPGGHISTIDTAVKTKGKPYKAKTPDRVPGSLPNFGKKRK